MSPRESAPATVHEARAARPSRPAPSAAACARRTTPVAPARIPTTCRDVESPRSVARSRPSQPTSATSVFEFPPSTATTATASRPASLTPGRRDRDVLELVDPDERPAVVAQPGHDRRGRLDGPARPRVEQDDGAI